jgi:hypothetical protein
MQMKSRLLVLVGLLLAALAVPVFQFSTVGAQNKNANANTATAATTPKKSRGMTIRLKGKEGGEKPTVKTSREDVLARGAAKKPAKTRGPYCDVYVTNQTGYYIDIYVDGDWAGTASPYSRAKTSAWPGHTTVFGESGNITWGPRSYNCGSNQYIDFVMTY